MDEIVRATEQMQRAFEGNAWYGPSLEEVLENVDARAAASRPIVNAHSIWEIVLHLIATQQLLIRRLEGDATAQSLAPEEDWPSPPGEGDAEWSSTLDRLRRNDTTFRAAAGRYPAGRLDEPLIPGGSVAYDNLHGYVQHTAYHAGQIALLRKAALGR